jgi:hypothetical protein
MRRILPFIILAAALLLAPSAPALADAAPPREPPGSNLLPAGETMVQMVAENVLIAIQPPSGGRSPANIEAVFSMRNHGAATESMDVRFPLEPVDGYGDGYGNRVLIEGFTASVDGRSVPVRRVDEPFLDGPAISWAVFPVTFEPGRAVEIAVDYSTQLYGDAWAQVDYILETGGGWYGPIGSAVVVLRLPYAASESNVFITSPWNPEPAAPPVFVGREVRWHRLGLEPTAEDNLTLTFAWPADWQHILDLEAQTGANPRDVSAAIALAEAYREAGSEKHGFMISDPLYHLSRTAVEEALAYSPDSLDLQVELASIEVWRCESYPGCSLEEVAALHETVSALAGAGLSEDELADLQWGLDMADAQAAFNATQQATLSATEAPPAVATSTPAVPTQEPTSAPSATATSAVTVEPGVPATRGFPEPLSGLAGLAVGIGATVAIGAVIKRRPPSG